jgi:glucose/arabinose dehydrogenase
VIKQRSWLAGFIAAFALLGAPTQSALAAHATPLSPSSLAFPAAFTVTPNGGRVLYGERYTGRIRWLNPATGATSQFFTIPNLATAGEQGLLGLVLHPSYPADTRAWVFTSRRKPGGRLSNELLRIWANGRGFTVLRRLPAAVSHNGGRILIGPDRKLYVVIGDNYSPTKAQSLAGQAGKVLRLNLDGTVPADNPRSGSPIIAYGIRNSFGFTFDPRTGRLWETENGPQCNDEINLVPRTKLTNFGWGPSQKCTSPPSAPHNTNRDGPNPVLPRFYFRDPPALTGAAFCTSCGLSSAGQLFFGDYNAGRIHRASLTSRRLDIASRRTYYDHPGRVLSVETPLDGGPIYFSTQSNIFRLRP